MTTLGVTRTRAEWASFGLWSLVGAGYAFGLLGLLTFGVFVLAATLVVTLLLLWSKVGRCGGIGIVAGAGLPLLYVAFLNRGGPGQVCTTTSDSVSCVEMWSPWPWAAAGLLLVAVGLALFVRRRSTTRAP